jgi:hypothetical protein
MTKAEHFKAGDTVRAVHLLKLDRSLAVPAGTVGVVTKNEGKWFRVNFQNSFMAWALWDELELVTSDEVPPEPSGRRASN